MAKENKLGLAAGIAAATGLVAAAAGVGYYMFGTKDAEKHRAKAAKWSRDMYKDVVKKAKKLKKIDQQALAAIVDESMAAYKTVQGVSSEDVQKAAEEIKGGWEHVKKEVSRALSAEKKKVAAKAGKDVKAVKGAVKVAAKKVVATAKKAAKKNAAVVKKAVKPAKKPVAKKAAKPAKKPVAKKPVARKGKK